MLRATAPLLKMASTRGGMRRILKRRLPVDRYIELAIKAGSYKTPSDRAHYLGLHDIPEEKDYLTPREREQRLKLRRGILDYPTEYEILSTNPPLPMPPKTPVKIRKRMLNDKRKYLAKLKKERKRRGLKDEDIPPEAPSMDRLVRSYLRRHQERLREGMSPSESRREEEYYSNLLMGQRGMAEAEREKEKIMRFTKPSSLRTHMGRKRMLMENAYAFAVRQQQVMLDGDGPMTEQEGADRAESLLREEARADRREGHEKALDLEAWRSSRGEVQGGAEGDGDDGASPSLPSILHDRPRAIRAMGIWSARLRTPYSRWTIGASTALDHWIAREVLQMDGRTWQQVLEAGGTDAYSEGMETLPGGETRRGLAERMRDIVVARTALFPETLGEGSGVGEDSEAEAFGGEDEATSVTERSIDELLASLGDINDDEEDGAAWKFDDFDDQNKEDDAAEGEVSSEEENISSIMDELQVWRQRNMSSPYEAWDTDRKEEFDKWIERYVTTLDPDADAGAVDKEATRASLLSERPVDPDKTKEFWARSRTETEADLFLRDYRSRAEKELDRLEELSARTPEDESLRSELKATLSVPFEKQLQKIVTMGTLRPILDDYATSTERESFLEQYSHIFMEGLEMEHLVLDPDGPIGIEDLGQSLREELSAEWTPGGASSTGGAADGRGPRFSIRMIAYGTDEYGTPRAERAREMYRMWNEHRANRARFEEALFKRGHLALVEDGKPRVRRKRNKGKKD